ncbi:ABC-type sugar transport system ATPase subunit [Catenibacillus scindens]|uniref:ABC-type sugar transport system ATPase subunit n=1 Tax=Catenibacillus scindens TaxID=673271 RepID=A0A7W8H7E9_9FIRM|nr:ATP-binding cassette domain-containing protein [Catenibacillus scindens]MBB5263286.1 ABC-type sugar transport system ATPase subunit [Catenibacillus scindens]
MGSQELLFMQNVVTGEGREALNGLDLHLCQGEVVELFGVSGAGKTALYNYFMGYEPLKEGYVAFNGRTYRPQERFADQKNVVCVSKNSTLIGGLTIAENICVIASRRKVRGLVHRKNINFRTNFLLQQYMPELRAEMTADTLTVSQRHMVELLRAVECEAKMIYIDDIMAGYGQGDFKRMERMLIALKEKNISILLARQGKDPLSSVSDRVVVLFRGKNVKTFYKEDYNTVTVNQWMLGSDTLAALRRSSYRTDKVIFSARRVQGPEYIASLTLDLHKGEVVGFYDMNNYANLEGARMLTGEEPYIFGQMRLNGRTYAPENLFQAINLGVGCIPWYRDVSGIVESMDCGENLFLPVMRKMSRWGIFYNKKAERFLAREYFSKTGISREFLGMRAEKLDVYNRVQLILTKWILTRPAILVCEELTEDSDLKMKNIILSAVDTLAANGTCVVITAHDMKDLMNICDTIYIMNSYADSKRAEKIQVMKNM